MGDGVREGGRDRDTCRTMCKLKNIVHMLESAIGDLANFFWF